MKTLLDEANDFLSMQEVLRRRYCKERKDDKRFGEKPNLILLDGGKPKLSAALKIFDELGLDLQNKKIALAGIAKSGEEFILPLPKKGQSLFGENNGGFNQVRDRFEFNNIILPDGSESLYLVKAVRDKAHRFAISFHRQLRAKGMAASILDEIPSLGPVRKKAILKAFGSFKRLREANLEQIKEKKIIPVDVAHELFLILHQND